MTIKLKKDNGYYYAGNIEFLNSINKRRADEIYKYSEDYLSGKKSRLVKRKGHNVLKNWHMRGQLINKIIKKFKILESEKKYFWLMLNEVSGDPVPERAKKFNSQNDFRTASILAKYAISRLEKGGSWGLWREILSSSKTSEDERVAEWIMGKALKEKPVNHKEVRPLLKFARNRLKKLDTSVLSRKELFDKLNEIKFIK